MSLEPSPLHSHLGHGAAARGPRGRALCTRQRQGEVDAIRDFLRCNISDLPGADALRHTAESRDEPRVDLRVNILPHKAVGVDVQFHRAPRKEFGAPGLEHATESIEEIQCKLWQIHHHMYAGWPM